MEDGRLGSGVCLLSAWTGREVEGQGWDITTPLTTQLGALGTYCTLYVHGCMHGYETSRRRSTHTRKPSLWRSAQSSQSLRLVSSRLKPKSNLPPSPYLRDPLAVLSTTDSGGKKRKDKRIARNLPPVSPALQCPSPRVPSVVIIHRRRCPRVPSPTNKPPVKDNCCHPPTPKDFSCPPATHRITVG